MKTNTAETNVALQTFESSEINDKLTASFLAYENTRRKKAIKNMFKRKSFSDDSKYELRNFFKFSFYWLKCLICLILNRAGGDTINAYKLIFWDQRQVHYEYSGYVWECCYVEQGFFKNWRICIILDSTY